MCSCWCVHSCSCEHASVCPCIWRLEVETMSSTVTFHSVSQSQTPFEPGAHLLTRLAGQQAPGVHLSVRTQHWVSRQLPCPLLRGFWGSEYRFLFFQGQHPTQSFCILKIASRFLTQDTRDAVQMAVIQYCLEGVCTCSA